MSGLFSHPSASPDVPKDRAEIRTAVSVPAPIDHAWTGLTEHLHLWWPADELSRWGDDSFFDLEDNALVETSAQEDEYVWGEVIDGHPGRWLELRWRHIGSDSTTAVRLDMSTGEEATTREELTSWGADEMPTEGAVTRLTITHTGWTTVDQQDVYDLYRAFWPDVLARYRRFMGGA